MATGTFANLKTKRKTMLLADIDITQFNVLLHDLQDALVGSGGNGDMNVIVKDEARLLAMEISNQLGPRTRESAERKIASDAKRVFKDGPKVAFEGEKRHGIMESNMEWLYATPQALIGVDRDDLMLGASNPAMQRRFNEFPLRQTEQGLRREGRGKKQFLRLGRRGSQAVMKYNRIVVGIGRTESFAHWLSGSRVGRMRSTFAYAASRLGQTRIAGWISKHFDKVKSDGRAIFDDAKLNDRDNPTIVFGSRAPGIDNFEERIMGAVATRIIKLQTKIQDIIHNYSEDHMAGRKIRRRAKATA